MGPKSNPYHNTQPQSCLRVVNLLLLSPVWQAAAGASWLGPGHRQCCQQGSGSEEGGREPCLKPQGAYGGHTQGQVLEAVNEWMEVVMTDETFSRIMKRGQVWTDG